MKDIKQKTLDIGDYVATLEKQLDKGFSGKITEITPITNKLYYKGGGGFEERDGFSVCVKVKEDDTEFTQWFSKPNIRGYEKSNLYLFKKKYNSVPKVDLIVEVEIDDNGFYRIRY